MTILPELRKFGNIKNPLFQFFLFLSVFAIVSTYDYVSTAPVAAAVSHILSTVVALVVSLVVLELTLRTTSLNPYNFLISTLIVILLVHPHEVFWQIPFTILCVWVGKRYFKLGGHHLFNPAALGLTIASFILLIGESFGLPVYIVSWWGADLGQQFLQSYQLFYLLVAGASLMGFLYFARAFRKLWYVGAFFLSYLAILMIRDWGSVGNVGILGALSTTIQGILLSSIAFMALVMFVEPKTSPVFPKQQVVVGITGALLLYVLNNFGSSIPLDPLLLTVLGVNIVTFALKTKRLLQ